MNNQRTDLVLDPRMLGAGDATAKSSRSLKDSILIAILSVIYVLSLEYIYLEIISPRYLYMGLRSGYPERYEYVIAIALTVLCSFFVPTTVQRPSASILIFLFLTVVAPSMLFPFHLVKFIDNGPLPLILAVAGCFILLGVMCQMKPISFPPMVSGRNLAISFLVVTGLLTIGLRFYLFRDIELDLNIYDVYYRRLAGREITGFRSFYAYALNLGTSGVGLLMVAIGLTKRLYSLFMLGLTVYFIAFLTVGNKDAIFTPLLVIVAIFMLRIKPSWFVTGIFVSLILLCWVGVLEVKYRGTYEVSSVVIRRQLIFPAAGNVSYWQYFSENPFYYWSDSFLRYFIKSPYPTGKAMWMGRMAGHINLSANANLWASAYADAGYFGMVLITVVMGYLCRILDGFSTRLGVPILMLVGLGLSAKLSNTALERVMVTHGGFAIFFFLYLLQPLENKLVLSQNRKNVSRSAAADRESGFGVSND
jgi:hypothetical protein